MIPDRKRTASPRTKSVNDFIKIIAFGNENLKNHIYIYIYTLCGNKKKYFNFKEGDTYSYNCLLKGKEVDPHMAI